VTTQADTQATNIAFVLIPRFNMTALTTTLEPLRVANYISTRGLYAWRYLSVEGGAVTASNGMRLETEALGEEDRGDGRRWDAVFVCGSWDSEHYENAALFAWLRRMDRAGVTLGAMDIGAFILARAKLLAGYRATAHWSCLPAFAEAHPGTTVEEQLFVIDRKRVTSAGGAAGLDLMLHEIAERHGRQLALAVADQVLHHPLREAAAPQRRNLGGKEEVLHPVVRKAVSLMEGNLEEPLAIPDVAAAAGVSQRKLERLFKSYMGCSAVSFYQVLRLQYARALLTNTDLSVREVSVASGFASLSYFSKSFSAHFGKRPRDYREAWPDLDPVPVWPGMTVSLMEAAKASRRRTDARRA
jgi:AraC family carnitine catabolism transcriptional activator